MNGTVNADPLFVGLTRPNLLFGVSLYFAVFNMMISAAILINTSSLWVILVAATLHLTGYLLCFKEPRLMELYINKIVNFMNCRNRIYYGANSYGF